MHSPVDKKESEEGRMVLFVLLLQLLLLHEVSALRFLRANDLVDVCVSVRKISDFVAVHCDSDATTTLDPKCVESFQEYARDSDVFKQCEAQAGQAGANGDDAQQQHSLHRFKELYGAWQQAHVCKLFHATEKKAAHECSGDNVHRPWNEAAWPLFCHQTFMSYKENRKDIDALCARTDNSPAFWEGFADYIASPTCKQYYDFVRDAAKRGCGRQDSQSSEDADSCVRMFQWYRENQRQVEIECLELYNTKPFYQGFYRWKKQAHPF